MTGRVLIWGALSALLAAVVAAGVAALVQQPRSIPAGAGPSLPALETPGDYGAVPDFTLTDRSGRPVRLADLAGRWWIADFIFTRCTGVCPLLTARMSSIAASLSKIPGGDGVRLVSFSVDPSWDTPEVLSRYADAQAPGVPPGRWLFLTGPADEIYRIVKDGFKLSVAERPPGMDGGPGDLITHSDRLVLVDPSGRIAGYYHGTDDDASARLIEEIARRLRERPL